MPVQRKHMIQIYLVIRIKGRVAAMKGLPEERAILLGRYIAENGATVRKAAKVFQISKSTVHMVVGI